MFANRFRTTALALAGAAIVTSTLFTPAALAAGIPTATTGAAELREFDPSKHPIKIPVADIEVKPVSATESNEHIIYKFNVKNLGPGAAKVKIEGRAVYFQTGLAQPEDILSNHEMVLQNGQEQQWAFTCPPVENSACWRASLTASPVGIDKNWDNNTVYLNAP